VVEDRIFCCGFQLPTKMSALLDLLMGIFRQQTLGGAALELAALAAPLSLAQLPAAAPPPDRATATAVVSRNEAAAVVPR
jgi:hypothetical protein